MTGWRFGERVAPVAIERPRPADRPYTNPPNGWLVFAADARLISGVTVGTRLNGFAAWYYAGREGKLRLSRLGQTVWACRSRLFHWFVCRCRIERGDSRAQPAGWVSSQNSDPPRDPMNNA
jgi:hypothetical protein